jgi:hypothetical protein
MQPIQPKPGYKTSEFYGTLAVNLAILISAIAEGLPPRYAAIGASVVTGLYSISRAIAKLRPL